MRAVKVIYRGKISSKRLVKPIFGLFAARVISGLRKWSFNGFRRLSSWHRQVLILHSKVSPQSVLLQQLILHLNRVDCDFLGLHLHPHNPRFLQLMSHITIFLNWPLSLCFTPLVLQKPLFFSPCFYMESRIVVLAHNPLL